MTVLDNHVAIDGQSTKYHSVHDWIIREGRSSTSTACSELPGGRPTQPLLQGGLRLCVRPQECAIATPVVPLWRAHYRCVSVVRSARV